MTKCILYTRLLQVHFWIIIINIYKTLTSVPSRGREGAWQKNKKGGGLAAPEHASPFIIWVDL